MTSLDAYQSIKTTSEGFYKEKGSKFLAFAIPCLNETEAKLHINQFRKAHPNACHVCFAWRFGTNPNRYIDRYSDDGEPSNSAGKPIHGQIVAYDVTNILIAVVRYYGGTNLGVGGLIHAYKTAAKDAMSQATITEAYVVDRFEVIFPYEEMGTIMHLLKKHGIEKFHQSFEGNQAKINFDIRQSKTQNINEQLNKIHTIKHKQLT